MRRYALFFVLRLVAALFFVMTAVYAIAAFSPFAFDHFIKPRVFAPVNQFVAVHHLLYLAAYALVAITLVPDVRAPRTRRLAIGYLIVFGIVGEWLYVNPLLPKLWNGPECVVAALAAFAPLAGLAIIDHVAAAESFAMRIGDWTPRLPSQSLLLACVTAAEYACFLFLMRGVVRGVTVMSSPALLWIACWALVLHALGAVAVYAIVTAATAIASATRRPLLWQHVGLIALIAAAMDAVMLKMILPTISFSEVWAVPVATVGACTLAATWSGWTLRQPALDVRAGAVGIVTRPIAPRRRGLNLAMLVALPIACFPLLSVIEKFDWNALGQKLVVMAFWLVAFSLSIAWIDREDARDDRRALAWILVPPAAVMAIALAFGFTSARLHRWTTDPWLHHDAALDRYAAVDTSFRVLYEWFVDHPGADPQFVRFLQTNTNIPHWAVPSTVPDVSLSAAPASRADRPPHVFWFVIDSLRRDYVSAYNRRVTFTPHLQELADDSLVFRNAFTRYGGTSMAVPSMWAGGLLLHSAYHPPFHPLNAVEKLIARAGYRPLLTLDHIMAPLLQRSTAVVEVNHGLDTMKFDMCNTTADLQRQADRVIASGQPLFAYSLIETLHISLVYNRPVPAGASYPGFYGPVASELRRLDGCFGRFVDYLKRTGLYDDSVIVVTADHGDSLGDNDAWGHGVRMAPEILRVPLIIHVPTRLKPQVVSDLGAIALSTDIAPTLYELAGLETRDAGPLFGAPLAATSEARLDPARRRRPFLVAASYAATYGMLRNNGRLLYVADVVNGREYQFDMAEGLLGRQIDITDDDRRLNRELIRKQVTELDEFYHYTPQAWNMRAR